MYERIADAVGKAVAYVVLAGLAWYFLAPLREAPPEFQRGLIGGLVLAYVVSIVIRA